MVQVLRRAAIAGACVVIASGVLAGCPGGGTDGGGGSSKESGGGSADAKAKAPSGIYESSLPDHSTWRIEFISGGQAKMTMIEGGVEDTHDATWVINGDSIMMQSPEGMTMQFRWSGSSLVATLGDISLTFEKK